MKRTLTINLNGQVFNIDEDAYEALQKYIHEIEAHYTAADENEIISDIEARIAELLTERINSHKNVVNMDDVNYAISTLGHPNQFEDDNTEEASSASKTKEEQRRIRHQNRRFYRDEDNRLLGGIAAGLAAYCNVDITLMRIIFAVLLICLSQVMIPLYIFVWLVAPKADSPAKKLEMKGVAPTIDNIQNYVASERFQSSANRIGRRLGDFMRWGFRIAAILVGVILATAGFAVLFVIIAATITAIAAGGSFLMFPFRDTATSIIFIITLTISIMIPTISLISTTVRLIRRQDKPRHTWLGWMWFAVWIVTTSSCLAIGVNAAASSASSINSLGQAFSHIKHLSSINDPIDETSDDVERIVETRLQGVKFNSVIASTNMKVELIRDTATYIEVMGTADMMRNIITEVKNKELLLTCRNTDEMWYAPAIYVHYTDLKKISGSASASILCFETIKTPELDIHATSASKVQLKTIDCGSVSAQASSAGSVRIAGDCSDLDVDGSSGCSINLSQLAAQTVEVDASSGADIKVNGYKITANASSGADIEINGSFIDAHASSGADIRYNPSAEITHRSESSGGSIRKKK